MITGDFKDQFKNMLEEQLNMCRRITRNIFQENVVNK